MSKCLNSVFHGDCLVVMKSIVKSTIDMIFCDLPYGNTACKWDFQIPMQDLWAEWDRVLKDDSAIVLTASQPFTSQVVSSNLENFRCEWIWRKPQGTNPLTANRLPMKNHEIVLVFSKGKCPYYPQKIFGAKAYSGFESKTGKQIGEVFNNRKSQHQNNDGSRFPTTIQEFKQEKGLHPTQKPVPLVEYFIRTYSKEGDLVLDCCAGSGTTGVACINTGRNYILIEKEEKYIEVIRKRLQERQKEEKQSLEGFFE